MNTVIVAKHFDGTEQLLHKSKIMSLLSDAKHIARHEYRQEWRREKFVLQALAGYCLNHDYASLRECRMDGTMVTWIIQAN